MQKNHIHMFRMMKNKILNSKLKTQKLKTYCLASHTRGEKIEPVGMFSSVRSLLIQMELMYIATRVSTSESIQPYEELTQQITTDSMGP